MDPGLKLNLCSVSDLNERWRWIRKGCTELWTNWDKPGRHSEEDLHPWSFCGGETVLLYAFRLFDGSPSESYIRRTLPEDVQIDSGMKITGKRKHSDGKKKSPNKVVKVECVIQENETDRSIKQMADSIRFEKLMNVKKNHYHFLDEEDQKMDESL